MLPLHGGGKSGKRDGTSLRGKDLSFQELRLKELLRRHVEATGSKKARQILEHFDERIPDFKKIIPYDYSHMLQLIGRFEAAGMTRDAAELEAFLKREE